MFLKVNAENKYIWEDVLYEIEPIEEDDLLSFDYYLRTTYMVNSKNYALEQFKYDCNDYSDDLQVIDTLPKLEKCVKRFDDFVGVFDKRDIVKCYGLAIFINCMYDLVKIYDIPFGDTLIILAKTHKQSHFDYSIWNPILDGKKPVVDFVITPFCYRRFVDFAYKKNDEVHNVEDDIIIYTPSYLASLETNIKNARDYLTSLAVVNR